MWHCVYVCVCLVVTTCAYSLFMGLGYDSFWQGFFVGLKDALHTLLQSESLTYVSEAPIPQAYCGHTARLSESAVESSLSQTGLPMSTEECFCTCLTYFAC